MGISLKPGVRLTATDQDAVLDTLGMRMGCYNEYLISGLKLVTP